MKHFITYMYFSFKFAIYASIFGGIGMIIGQYFDPLAHHVIHTAKWSALIFTGMTLGMIATCIPACLHYSTCLKEYFNFKSRCIIHGFG